MAEPNGLIVNRKQYGIVVVDNGAKIHLINRAARSLLGYTAANKPLTSRKSPIRSIACF
ncbi:MAG TPA: PAS domain-containing protein [Gammaproteobacteria bacterium]|nr:PAS domain-containing protein [Gammaproteobacteria bacterium]